MIRVHGRVRVTRSLALIGTTVALIFSATVVFGQIELAAVQGTVNDEEGKPIEGVTVTLRDPDRGRAIDVETDKNGRFYRRGLRAIEYEMKVAKDGYQPIQDKITLNAGVEKRYDFTLVRAAPPGAEEFMQGVEAFNRGDNAAAATAFEAALAKAPGAPEVMINLGLAYLRLERTDDAIKMLEKAAMLAPNAPSVLFQLGGAYVEAQQNDKAIAAFEKGLGQETDLATNQLAYEATVTLGAVYFAEGKVDESIAVFERARAVRPDGPAPNLGLGKCYFSKGDVEKALASFQKVVAAAPGTPEAAEAERFIQELQKSNQPGA